jgi:two-component sensor histidine kinase
VDPDTVATMGLTLVTSLTKQIHGALTLDRTEGTTFVIRFRIT